MIVSHRHRFIFFAVPRTASHSIRAVLRPLLGKDDWEQEMLSGRSRLPIDPLAAIGHGHISVAEAAAHLPPAIWRDYYKFAFVREPHSRFVSVCRFLQRGNPGFRERPRATMRMLIGRRRFRERVLVRPQSALLTDASGRIPLDRVGRYERLEQDFAAICRDLSIAPQRLAERNAAPGTPIALDEELSQWVRTFYRADFDAFGYPVMSCSAVEERSCN